MIPARLSVVALSAVGFSEIANPKAAVVVLIEKNRQ